MPTAGRQHLPHRPAAWFVAAIFALFLAGCSTPGPLHLYSLAPGATAIHDVALDGRDSAHDTPSYLESADQLTGFAYDPFTDHFFLRLAPGDHIRVVDRPARKIKSEFVIKGAPANGGGDLAVNPRTGHLYLVDPAGPRVIEATRLGKKLRVISLSDQTESAAAIAFDFSQDQLLVLNPDHRTVERFDLSGQRVATVPLDRPVEPSLGFSSGPSLLYAPLGDGTPRVGVFDANGRLTRTVTIPAGDRFIDVGPHSFLRVF